MRKLLAVTAILFLSIVLFAAYQFWRNNRAVDVPSPPSVSTSLEKGIGWLVNNRDKILNENNPMLWWMVMESAGITQDKRLQLLFSEYRSRQLDPHPDSPWWYLFDPQSKVPITIAQLSRLPDYNLYFIYGASCSSVLAQDEIVRRQGNSEFCPMYHPVSPACATHQMMGARFVQKNSCLDTHEIQDLIQKLQARIVSQLTWDPRVVDVYIQRVLMLAESGAIRQVKPAWLQRVLDAQSADGGWGGIHPLFPVGLSYYFGFAGNGIGVRQLSSDFHATAQGVLLMSLVANEARKDRGTQMTVK